MILMRPDSDLGLKDEESRDQTRMTRSDSSYVSARSTNSGGNGLWHSIWQINVMPTVNKHH